jgi:hypothetical protein
MLLLPGVDEDPIADGGLDVRMSVGTLNNRPESKVLVPAVMDEAIPTSSGDRLRGSDVNQAGGYSSAVRAFHPYGAFCDR